MEEHAGPRFVWIQETSGIVDIYDTRPEDSRPAQALRFATTRSVEAAQMICLALNGA